MNKPRSFEEVQTCLNQLETRLAKFETRDIDLHQRKVINASDGTDKQDYVTLSQLISSVTGSTQSVDQTSSQSVSTPLSVGSVSLTGQTTNISGNILAHGSMATAGQYILYMYINCTTAGSGGAGLVFNVIFNDGVSSKTWPWSCSLL